MIANSTTIVQRLWNYCNVLRDERRFESARAVPEGEAVLRSAFEGRLG